MLKNNDRGCLTPFATSHLENLKGKAHEYVVNVVGDDTYHVYIPGKKHLGHVVNWQLKTCTNCHFFQERLLPCTHLISVWLNRGGKNEDGGHDGVYDHLFGKPYFLETLHNSLEDVSSALPWSLESVPHPSVFNVPLQLLHTKAAPGRPSTTRLASSMDNFRTGAKRKLSRAHTSIVDGKGEDGKVENVSSDKENIEGNICEVVSQQEVLIDDYPSL